MRPFRLTILHSVSLNLSTNTERDCLLLLLLSTVTIQTYHLSLQCLLLYVRFYCSLTDPAVQLWFEFDSNSNGGQWPSGNVISNLFDGQRKVNYVICLCAETAGDLAGWPTASYWPGAALLGTRPATTHRLREGKYFLLGNI